MKVTFIAHSGFLLETAACYYLFDYYQGELPILMNHKPILVFSSHSHGDHYNPEIFSLLKSCGMKQIYGILSDDIPQKKYPTDFPDIICIKVTFHQTYSLPCDTTLYTLKSTDEGVAFLLKCAEGTIYHAGDLNDWVWDGEPEADNRQMTSNYRHELQLLRSIQKENLNDLPLDIAFVPLDPRQEMYYANGMLSFLNTIPVKTVYPMHYWEQPEIIDQFLKEYAVYVNKIY